MCPPEENQAPPSSRNESETLPSLGAADRRGVPARERARLAAATLRLKLLGLCLAATMVVGMAGILLGLVGTLWSGLALLRCFGVRMLGAGQLYEPFRAPPAEPTQAAELTSRKDGTDLDRPDRIG